MSNTSAFDAADLFLEEAKRADPARYAELEKRFPVESQYDALRQKLGEPPGRTRKRRANDGLGTGRYVHPSMRRQFTDAEWADVQRAWHGGQSDMDEIERHAEELAAEGMRGY